MLSCVNKMSVCTSVNACTVNSNLASVGHMRADAAFARMCTNNDKYKTHMEGYANLVGPKRCVFECHVE